MIDQKLVESQVIQQMIEQLQLEGLKGQISSVKGLIMPPANPAFIKQAFTLKE